MQRSQRALGCYFENGSTVAGAAPAGRGPIEIAVRGLNQPIPGPAPTLKLRSVSVVNVP